MPFQFGNRVVVPLLFSAQFPENGIFKPLTVKSLGSPKELS